MKRSVVLSWFILLMINCKPAGAGVVDSSFYGFTISHELNITAGPDSVYNSIVRDIGKWWDPEHTYSGNAANLYIRATSDGCFCESLPGGGIVRHMSVIFVDPGKMLRLSGGLGPLQSMGVTGVMTFILKRTNAGTTLKVLYVAGGYAPSGLARVAPMVDKVLGQQLSRLKSYIEPQANPAGTGKATPQK